MSSSRKDDHLKLAAAQHEDRPRSDWDEVRVLHHALAGIDAERVDLGTTLPGGISWDLPFYINGMTGGSALTGQVNAALGEAAAETGIPIATGSMSMYLKDPSTLASFRVLREKNPHGFVMANVGADATVDQARAVVEALGADALQLHVNAVQETVMPEGSRNFSSWPARIEAVAAEAGVPVVVKEVGFGMTRETLLRLGDLGVQIADVSGRGGTNFARIENARRPEQDYSFLQDFGQSAPASLLDALSLPRQAPRTSRAGFGPGAEEPTGPRMPALLASGGVRHPYDVLRGLALGARAVGVAGTFLDVVLEDRSTGSAAGGAERLVARVQAWRQQVAELMALVGAARPQELTGTDVVVTGELARTAQLRNTDLAALAMRSSARH